MKAQFLGMKNIEMVPEIVTIKSSMKDEDVPKIENLVNSLLENN